MGTVRYTVMDGEIVSENRNGVKRDYVPDPLGSTVALLNETQVQTGTFSYWPYGEDAGRAGITDTRFAYVGTLGYSTDASVDSDARLYVRARYLHSTHAKWLNQDPIGFEGGDYNLYRYTLNNPVNNIDPSGNRAVCCTIHCYLNHEGKDPTCLNRDPPFIGRGCAADETEAYKLANDQADDALRRWNAKRGSHCQFKHCDNEGCERDRGQRGRRKAGGGVPAPVRWLANCSDAQLVGLCIITATGIVLCIPVLIPIIVVNRPRIPAQ
jgi:RHS repeat-associated protein